MGRHKKVEQPFMSFKRTAYICWCAKTGAITNISWCQSWVEQECCSDQGKDWGKCVMEDGFRTAYVRLVPIHELPSDIKGKR